MDDLLARGRQSLAAQAVCRCDVFAFREGRDELCARRQADRAARRPLVSRGVT